MSFCIQRCPRMCYRIWRVKQSCSVPRPNHTSVQNGEDFSKRSFKTFKDMISFRRLQAKRSALIGINNESSIDEVLTICKNFGTLNRKIVFNPRESSGYQFCVLVEFSSDEELSGLLNSCQHPQVTGSLPVFSRLLCHSSSGNLNKSLNDLHAEGQLDVHVEQAEEMKLKEISTCKDVSEQIYFFHKKMSLHDLGSRLRFLFCMQVEDSLRGLQPHCQVLPFGSSVNGFGSYNSDLDIFLNLSSQQGTGKGLMFQSPSRHMANDRICTQMTLETLGDLIQNFFPGVTNLQRILRARVPILKMHHTLAELDCDISISNGTGFFMSELLFLLGELDTRVRPLVFAVRKWASALQLTREASGTFISNFSLSLLVLFFLQNQNPPILPTIGQLREMAGPEDVQMYEEVDCTFKRSFTEIPKTSNTEDVGSLLLKFLHFCQKTNWENTAVSLVTGKTFYKPDSSAMYIENPLEPSLNVSRIVRKNEVDKFVLAVTDSLWELESTSENINFFRFLESRVKNERPAKIHKGLNLKLLFHKPYSNSSQETDSSTLQNNVGISVNKYETHIKKLKSTQAPVASQNRVQSNHSSKVGNTPKMTKSQTPSRRKQIKYDEL